MNSKIDTDYIPLNLDTIKSGQYFGVYKYSISQSSHEHHFEYLKRGNSDRFLDFNYDLLCSFEMYPLPRVLSINGGFKRVNEIISVYGERIVAKFPKANENLLCEVFADKIFKRNGIVYGYFTSKTRTESNELLMTSFDKAILLNQTDKVKFKEIIEKKKKMVPSLDSSKSVKLVNSLILFFRHEWNDKIWKNNIHTDSYAKYLGYDKGLIEAPCFVDILLSNIEVGKLMKNKISFKWEYYAPLYHGISVNVFLEEDEKIHTLYVCHKSDNTILMTLNIHNNEK